VALRRNRVSEHGSLGIFPASYDPVGPESERIWRPLTPGAKWLGPTAYYVLNPYLLIVAVQANHVTPLSLSCPGGSVRYEDRKFVQRLTGAAARCWLDRVQQSDVAGTVRLVMVNAYDAGLRLVHLDPARSENVVRGADATDVSNGFFTQPSLFHVGRYGVNNISPEDQRGWVRLARPGARTRLHVGLWRSRPSSVAADPDIVWEIVVDPEGG
jgi:hypothetical protein